MGSKWILVIISMVNMNCRMFQLSQSMEMYLRPLEGLSPARGDVLTIELESRKTPVSRVLYRLAPAEMAELKERMEDSSDKRFIRPSNSPWEAPVLFVKKKK